MNRRGKPQGFLPDPEHGEGTIAKRPEVVLFFLALVSFAGLCYPQDTAITLTASAASGFLSITNINNEEVEPNSGVAGSKDFDYPYYFRVYRPCCNYRVRLAWPEVVRA
jgi:hypothetical protein